MTKEELLELLRSWGREGDVDAGNARFIRNHNVLPAELINDKDVQALATSVVLFYLSMQRYSDALEMLIFIPLDSTDVLNIEDLRQDVAWKACAEKIMYLERMFIFCLSVRSLPLDEGVKQEIIDYAAIMPHLCMNPDTRHQFEQALSKNIKRIEFATLVRLYKDICLHLACQSTI